MCALFFPAPTPHMLCHSADTTAVFLLFQAFEELWRLLDVNRDGALDYGEFVRGFIGEMNESRKAYVRKVFLDMTDAI